jgi:hypothetical protein
MRIADCGFKRKESGVSKNRYSAFDFLILDSDSWILDSLISNFRHFRHFSSF